MKKLVSVFVLVTLMMSAASAFAAKVDTVRFQVNVHCNSCKEKIMENIAFEKGVKDIHVSIEDELVVIAYKANKNTPEGLKDALVKLGYEVKILKDGEEPSKDEAPAEKKKCTSDTTKCKGKEVKTDKCCDKSKQDTTQVKKCNGDHAHAGAEHKCQGHADKSTKCKSQDTSSKDKKCCDKSKETSSADTKKCNGHNHGDAEKKCSGNHDHGDKKCNGENHDHGDKKSCTKDKETTGENAKECENYNNAGKDTKKCCSKSK